MDTPDGGAFPDDFVKCLHAQNAKQGMLLINKQWTLAAPRPAGNLQRHQPDWGSLTDSGSCQNTKPECTDRLQSARKHPGKTRQ